MVWHYKATIVDLKLTNMAANCLDAFGYIKNPVVKQDVVEKIKQDLIQIMQGVVETSLSYFGKTRGTMANSLRNGIQVKGRTPVSLEAILHGVDYTLIHEGDVTLKPRHARMLAIPLRAACHADGRPILAGGPKLWKHYKKTFVISGEKAASRKRNGRQSKPSAINPHATSEVAYIVYRDNTRGHEHLVYLYKLVPYSLFKEGYQNIYGQELKKLGLEKRLYAAIESAWAGWYDYIVGKLTEAQDFGSLEVYKGINIKKEWIKATSTYNIPIGSPAGFKKASAKGAGVVNAVITINRS